MIFFSYSPTLEDEDARKRRRKKERSSLFFRKKKDKVSNKGGSTTSGPPVIGPPLFDQSHGPQGFEKMVPTSLPSSRAISSVNSAGLTKVSSSINLGSGSFGTGSAKNAPPGSLGHAKFSQQHSYSMSSLRKGSGMLQNPSYLGPSSSNFYVVKPDGG